MAEEPNNLQNQIPPIEPTPGAGKEKFIIRPLRTYEEDVATFVKRGQVTTAKIVVAEQKRQQEITSAKGAEESQKTSGLALKISGILIVLAAVILAGVFYFLKPTEDTPVVPTVSSGLRDILIDKKETFQIPIDNKITLEIKDAVVDYIESPPVLGLNEIAEIQLTKKISGATEGGIMDEKIKIAEMLSVMELRPLETTVRSFDENYIFGLINIEGQTIPFILIKTLEFEQVFSGMLVWEKTLYREINDIFFDTLGTDDFLVVNPNASSTVTNGNSSFDPQKFTDIVIYNRDARAIIDNNDKVLFFYTFVNNNHILLTSKTAAVEEIAKKLNLQNIVR